MGEFLSLWQESKQRAHEKFVYRVSELPYRSNWYCERRVKRPEETWPDEVRAWRSFQECTVGNSARFISQGNVEQIRDYLLNLRPTEKDVETECDPNLSSLKRSFGFGCIKEQKRVFCYFVCELQPWLESHFDLSPGAALAGASVYVCVLNGFLPFGKTREDYFRKLPVDEMIQLLLTEGYSGMTISKVTRSYHPTTMQDMHERIRRLNGGDWPISTTD